MRDAVDHLTPLGVMVLALLREGAMHPYEMMRLMRHRREDRLVTITNGTMYHTVARLERAGLLVEVGVDRAGNRPERTTYALTGAGRDTVVGWVRRELPRTDRPSEFRIALAEAHNLDRREVIELLIARRGGLAAQHVAHRDGRAGAISRGVAQQFLVELEREEVVLESELRWLDDLLGRLEQHAFPWGPEETGPHSDLFLSERKAARL